MERINKLMYEHDKEKLLRVSGSIGSEAGVMSIGSGSGVDHILIMATYINRHEREETIWDISNYLRAEIAKIPHVKYLDVAPSGSTAMASIRASVDTMLSSPDYKLLQKEGAKVEEAMNQTKGIVSVLKTWDMDKVVYNLNINEKEAMDYTVHVWLPQKQIDNFKSILSTLIVMPKGKIPLTIIGASWTMPAMMGFMLLSGIIVNNAILLIHFALEQIKLGMNKRDAMLESIKIRTRPVLMTAFAVSVGMLPVAQGSAIGLERLAPLGAVAIGGLVVGTLMTLIFIPIGFIWLVDEKAVVEE